MSFTAWSSGGVNLYYAVFTRSVCLDEWHRLVTIGVFVNRFFVVQAVFGYDRTWGNKFELDITYV